MDSEEEEKKSRSQLKREFDDVKELVKELVALTPGQLQNVPISQGTRDQILTAKKMVRSPLKRQLRHVAQWVVEEDVSAIRDALSGTPKVDPDTPAAPPHEAERWRDELISGDNQLLPQFVAEHPDVDRQRLRQLVRNARKERAADESQKSSDQLLRYVMSFFDE